MTSCSRLATFNDSVVAMQGLKNLFSDTHGLVMLALIAAASVLAGTGRMTVDQWTAYSQWIFAAWMGGHAVITASGAIAQRRGAVPKLMSAASGSAPTATPLTPPPSSTPAAGVPTVAVPPPKTSKP